MTLHTPDLWVRLKSDNEMVQISLFFIELSTENISSTNLPCLTSVLPGDTSDSRNSSTGCNIYNFGI